MRYERDSNQINSQIECALGISGHCSIVINMEWITPSLPAYVQIADSLRAQIDNKVLRPGDRLPSERSLMTQFEVSRMTLRHALKILRSEGLIRSKRGRGGGNFVTAAPPLVEINRMEGFLPQLRDREMQVSSTLIHTDLVTATEKHRAALGLAKGEQLFNIVRLRTVNNSPMLIEDSYFPVVIAPDLLHQDLEGSLYELLANVYQHKPTAKWESFLPVAAQVREQQLLKVSAQHPLLKIHRVAYDQSNTAVEYSEDILRCDAAQIMVTTNLRDQQLPRPGQP